MSKFEKNYTNYVADGAGFYREKKKTYANFNRFYNNLLCFRKLSLPAGRFIFALPSIVFLNSYLVSK